MSDGWRFNRGGSQSGIGPNRDASVTPIHDSSPHYWEKNYRIKNFKELYPRDFNPKEADELTKWLFQKEKKGFLLKTKTNVETIKEILSLKQ